MTQLCTMYVKLTLGLRGLLRHGLEDDEGQTLAEYGLILALVAAVVVGVLVTLSGTISGMFTTASSQI